MLFQVPQKEDIKMLHNFSSPVTVYLNTIN